MKNFGTGSRREPRPDAKCRHHKCGRPYAEHAAGACPSRPDRQFRRDRPSLSRASCSLSDAELRFLDAVLRALPRCADMRMLARGSECSSVARKVYRMRARVAELRAQSTVKETLRELRARGAL